MNVYIVTEEWYWDGDWTIDSVHATEATARARAEKMRSVRDAFSIKNGLDYDVQTHSVVTANE